ncbi:subtilisin family serine protease [Herbihabitans rhizosphaerae]|uniref:Subtilisin family serine protease n=1 Tax=Herbihabitans rhizosphaerae TaxID=1872711 RepID=A0A4Q7KFA1_9PSEU|nr:PKD domain-containing protein [Herbihabitans rhizosphaerae]RZS30341.1 subtilisin family serine protease [Herbihabitans rhizosphaerae]
MSTNRRRVPALMLGATASLALAFGSVGTAQAAEGQILGAGTADAIPGSYIVAMKGETSKDAGVRAAVGTQASSLAGKYGGKLGLVYSTAFRGFAVNMSEAQAKRLAADPAVEYVEQNATVRVEETWGLDRVDQRDLPLSNSYTAPNDGAGATAYIVDTGVDMRHTDFGGRVTSGRDFIDNDNDASDCQGHGTHVAGSVGSKTWGVAKNVKLVAVRVLNCQGTGSWDQVIGGIDWVTQNAPEAAVGNMSLGGAKSTSVNSAVQRSLDAGVSWAVAAGNEGQDACNVSPASTPGALTVAASDAQDKRSIWTGTQSSNYGTCVDLFGPGSNITSTLNGGGSGAKGGTSMATPHVAGALALAITADPSGSVSALNDKVVSTTTPNKITDIKGSPNKLLYVNDLGGGGGNTDPTASFTSNCSTAEPSCGFDASGSTDPNGTISSYAWEFGDGQTGDGVTPSHTYATAGKYTVKLTVTDNEGKTNSTTREVTAGQGSTGQPPSASFRVNCQWAACQFDGNGSTDPDRDIDSYSWEFGDGQTGSGVTTSHSYPNRQATYTAKLTVKDRSGNSNSATKQIQCWSFGTQSFCFSQ